MRRSFALVLTVIGMVMPFSAQEAQPDAGHRRAYEQLLDLYVRDGLVYYRALRAERARLDGYVGALGGASIESASREERLAFWLNAYNALVLKTVVDHYPIPLRSKDYPAHSIRQIPGAFERLPHRVAGQMLTLDQIEQMVLPMFADPRVYLALGRGAIGSGRLRSEPFAAATIETQLAEAAAECATRGQCVEIDRSNNQVGVSSIFSWRSASFIDAYAARAPGTFSARSPIERAVLALVEPKLLTTEKEFLAQNQFTVVYKPFDWSLNDLTGRGGR
jgi:hypothetical protein